MEEKELVRLSQRGDENAFERLVKKYQKKVFHLAFGFTRDRETADDLAQEAFIKAYFNLPRFQFKSEFSTWLYRITINTIKDYLRKKERMSKISLQDMAEKPFYAEDEAKQRERQKREEERRRSVHRVILSLPEKYRIILTLRDIHGMSYEEISRLLRISPGTVDSRLHRARKILRERMEPFLRGGDDEMQKI
ncbi:MAG: RNA polymerase sigma factor [Candidatus Aminicenantales bacterium]